MSNNSKNRNLYFEQNNFSAAYNQDASCMILTWKADTSEAIGVQNSNEPQITRVQYWVTDDFSNLRQGEAKGIAANLEELDKVGEISAFMHTNVMVESNKNTEQGQQLSDFFHLGKHLN